MCQMQSLNNGNTSALLPLLMWSACWQPLLPIASRTWGSQVRNSFVVPHRFECKINNKYLAPRKINLATGSDSWPSPCLPVRGLLAFRPN